MAIARHLSLSLYYISLSIFAACLAAFVNCDDNLNRSSSTPINRDLYHSSGDLMEMIKNLVHRHTDKLSMDTIEAGNKGYNAEITVVTYCHRRKDCDDRSKIRILLMIPCLPEFWAAW